MKSVYRATWLLSLLVSAPLAAQTASVEGDVYLLMKNCDTKQGSGRTVLLLQQNDSLVAARSLACAAYTTAAAARLTTLQSIEAKVKSGTMVATDVDSIRSLFGKTMAADTAESIVVQGAILRAFRLGTIAETGTGMVAHYKFTKLKPGNYVVYSSWDIANNQYRWWAPVSVKTGQAVTRDLDNSVEIAGSVPVGLALCSTTIR